MTTGVLTSYHYFRGFDFDRLPASVPLVMDSGAFSAYTSGATITTGDYAAWLTDTAPRWRFAFNLDVLADPKASLANWRTLADHGHRTVPVIHYGDQPAAVLPPYLAAGADRVALGGLAVSPTRPAMRWTAACFAWLRDHHPHIPVHGLGIHMRSPAARLGWSSTDSSAFTAAWRYGRLGLYDPATRRWATVPLDGRATHRYGRLLRSYGFTPAEVAESDTHTREALVRLATLVECRAADDWPGDRYLTTKPSVVTGIGLADVAHTVDRYLTTTLGTVVKGQPDIGVSVIADTIAGV